MRTVLTLFVVVFSCGLSQAQLNLKASYRFAVTNPTTFNSIIQEHNRVVEEDAEYRYSSAFEDLKVMNGFELGLRYKVSTVAFEFGWMHKRRQLRADGRRFNGNSFQNSITTSINTITLGFFPEFGLISLGATIDYNYLKIKTDFELPSDIVFVKDNAWSSQFSLSLNFGNGGRFAFTLRPYIDVYWSEFNINELDQTLQNPEVPYAPPKLEDFASWGISFIIFNGPQ